MALYVVDKSEGGKVPFLRGILTRSLVKAGLSFDEAYQVADHTREKLSNKGQISTEDLKALVISRLEKLGHDDALARYRLRGQQLPLTVIGRDEVSNPFSRTALEQSLEICSLSPESTNAATAAIEEKVRGLGRPVVPSSTIASMVYDHLREFESKQAAKRYLLWLQFVRSGKPLVLLIGGTTGSGKSSVSAELSHRLNIVRTQSTDMLREVMRLMMPKRLLPTLHESSFNAYKAIPNSSIRKGDAENALEVGYLTQAERVGVAVQAVMERAVTERVSIIIEGVHVNPQLMRELSSDIDAIVVPTLIVVPKRKNLRKQLKGRGQQISSRRSQRYMENFDAIWALQTFLIAEAEKHEVTVVPNTDLEDTTDLLKEYISEVLMENFEADPSILETGLAKEAV